MCAFSFDSHTHVYILFEQARTTAEDACSMEGTSVGLTEYLDGAMTGLAILLPSVCRCQRNLKSVM